MRNGLWGHAMMLAAKMDKKVHNDVITRYKALTLSSLSCDNPFFRDGINMHSLCIKVYENNDRLRSHSHCL